MLQAYQTYCRKYLAVPEDLQEIRKLSEELEARYPREDVFMNPLQIMWTAELVRAVVFENTQYSLKLPELPEGKDVTEYFLFESHRGFCQHYASAGVLLLREMGVPARYVTGY